MTSCSCCPNWGWWRNDKVRGRLRNPALGSCTHTSSECALSWCMATPHLPTGTQTVPLARELAPVLIPAATQLFIKAT